MSVRKRTWKSKNGETREAWIVDYSDQLGSRHLKTFRRKRDADQYHATVALDVRSGIHTADSTSVTVEAAAPGPVHVDPQKLIERLKQSDVWVEPPR
jgi:integrase